MNIPLSMSQPERDPIFDIPIDTGEQEKLLYSDINYRRAGLEDLVRLSTLELSTADVMLKYIEKTLNPDAKLLSQLFTSDILKAGLPTVPSESHIRKKPVQLPRSEQEYEKWIQGSQQSIVILANNDKDGYGAGSLVAEKGEKINRIRVINVHFVNVGKKVGQNMIQLACQFLGDEKEIEFYLVMNMSIYSDKLFEAFRLEGFERTADCIWVPIQVVYRPSDGNKLVVKKEMLVQFVRLVRPSRSERELRKLQAREQKIPYLPVEPEPTTEAEPIITTECKQEQKVDRSVIATQEQTSKGIFELFRRTGEIINDVVEVIRKKTTGSLSPDGKDDKV